MKLKFRNKYVYAIIIVIIIILSVVTFSRNNMTSLYIRAALQDRPSKQYYDIIEKIYNKVDIDNISKITSYIDDGSSPNLHELYVHTLGIFGYNDPKGYYLKLLTKYNDSNHNISTINSIYLSMGLSGGSEYVDFLSKSLENQDNINIAYRRYLVALSLYLLTGKSYVYINPQEKREEFIIQDYIVKARDVIVNSKNRVRTLEEMITLDKLTRPYGW